MVGGKAPEAQGRPNNGQKAKGISQFDYLPKKPTIMSRRIAIIIADGYNAAEYNAIKAAFSAAQALPFTIAPRRSPIYAAGEQRGSGKGVKPDHHLEGMRSTMFDAIYIPGGAESVATLSKSGRALHWIREAFGHLKAIGATGEAAGLVNHAIGLDQVVCSTAADVVDSFGVVTAAKVQPDSFKEIVSMAKEATSFIETFAHEISMHRNWDRELEGLNSMVAY